MRDSLIFYRSFYEAIKELPSDDQAILYNAIFEYSLNFNEVDLSGLPKALFTLIRPQLDANIKRYENGKQGGRKKQTETETEPKENQTETKTKANKNVNVNVNVNNNLNHNINKTFVAIENLHDSLKVFQGDKRYLFFAYRFWELWKKDNENSRTVNDAKIGKWIDDVRKIIEIDKTSTERLIGIYCYFENCQKQIIGFDDFWFKTIKSIAGFRKKSKDGVYYTDKIIDKVNDKREKDEEFRKKVDLMIKNFNEKFK